MFYSIENFPFLKPFIQDVDILKSEFRKAQTEIKILDDFIKSEKHFSLKHVYYWAIETMGKDDYYPDDDHRDEGVWAGFPLFKEYFPIKEYDVNHYFPHTLKLIKNIPDVYFATYMRLSPNGLISTHQHKLPNLIFHISLVDNPTGSTMKCGDFAKELKKVGDYAIFDYRLPHSTRNNGTVDRINLVIDFRNTMISNELIQDTEQYFSTKKLES